MFPDLVSARNSRFFSVSQPSTSSPLNIAGPRRWTSPAQALQGNNFISFFFRISYKT